jgi:CBS domain-containing protein
MPTVAGFMAPASDVIFGLPGYSVKVIAEAMLENYVGCVVIMDNKAKDDYVFEVMRATPLVTALLYIQFFF